MRKDIKEIVGIRKCRRSSWSLRQPWAWKLADKVHIQPEEEIASIRSAERLSLKVDQKRKHSLMSQVVRFTTKPTPATQIRNLSKNKSTCIQLEVGVTPNEPLARPSPTSRAICEASKTPSWTPRRPSSRSTAVSKNNWTSNCWAIADPMAKRKQRNSWYSPKAFSKSSDWKLAF